MTIAKVTDHATGETGFTFGGDLGAFALDGGDSQLFQLTPGSYTITEAVKSGWELTDAACTPSGASVTDGVSLTVVRGDVVTCTFVNDPLPAIEISKTAAETSLPEPGASVTFTLRITNTTTENIILMKLVDDAYGDLNGQGTCATGVTIVGNGATECVFSGEVSGNARDTFTDAVTATVTDGESNLATATDSASVMLTDVLPEIAVTKTASPDVLPVGGGVVTFTVTVANLSVEPVMLVSLYDDNLYRALVGDLNGIGSCFVGEWIDVDSDYRCVLVQTVTGSGGGVRNDKVTATTIDDENNIVSADSTAGAIINTPPQFISTPQLTATVGAPYRYIVTVTDIDDDAIVIAAPVLPVWLTFTDNGDGTATLSGTPAADDASVATVQILADDGLDEASQFFDISTSTAPAPNIFIFLPLVIK